MKIYSIKISTMYEVNSNIDAALRMNIQIISDNIAINDP